MGFSIYYRIAEPVDADRRTDLIQAAQRLAAEYSWANCEPPILQVLPDGTVWGASKPNLMDFSQEDIEADKPNGNVNDLAECLCRMSQEFEIDWIISADDVPDGIGYISNGDLDQNVITFFDFLDEVRGFRFEEQGFQARPPKKRPPSDHLGDDDEDEFPPTIRLWPEPE